MTKRVKYTAIWKKSIKTVKESKSCFTYPSPFSILFPSSIFSFSLSTILLFSLLNVFIPSSTIFYYFPSSMFFIPLLHLHLLIYSIYFSIQKYIDLLLIISNRNVFAMVSKKIITFGLKIGLILDALQYANCSSGGNGQLINLLSSPFVKFVF